MDDNKEVYGRSSDVKEKKSSFLYEEEEKQEEIFDYHDETVVQEDDCSYCNIQFTPQELNKG